ncbi:MAG: DEAD/DEAH box helicase [Spirochaetales bacterium]|nr:DEAD/DEAH box helicase [Spirochaetales bacterium]
MMEVGGQKSPELYKKAQLGSRFCINEEWIRVQNGNMKQTEWKHHKIIKPILKGKDIVIEAGGTSLGKETLFVLPLISKIKKWHEGLKALILVPGLTTGKLIYKEIRGEYPKIRSLFLGLEEEPRDEYRSLLKNPPIVISTPQRVIDHIRRGNINFNHLRFIFLSTPEARLFQGYEADFYFIKSKCPRNIQIIAMIPRITPETSQFINSLKMPLIKYNAEWDANKKSLGLYYHELLNEKEKFPLLRDLLLSLHSESILICLNRKGQKKVKSVIKEMGFKALIIRDNPETNELIDLSNAILRKKSFILLASALHPDFNEHLSFSTIIYFDKPYLKRGSFAKTVNNLQSTRQILFFTLSGEKQEIKKVEETLKMEVKKGQEPQEEEITLNFTEHLLKKLDQAAGIDALKEIKKIIYKKVSFFKRSWFTAILFKELLDRTRGRKAASKYSRLFISAGKNRRVFAKELIELFTGNLPLEKTDIKEIKIKDNYSFVNIPTQFAQQAIDSLSGKEFNGRKLSLDFAKNKQKGNRTRGNSRPKRTPPRAD